MLNKSQEGVDIVRVVAALPGADATDTCSNIALDSIGEAFVAIRAATLDSG